MNGVDDGMRKEHIRYEKWRIPKGSRSASLKTLEGGTVVHH
jgi:hypothetical protein